jgi:hypothetical protein
MFGSYAIRRNEGLVIAFAVALLTGLVLGGLFPDDGLDPASFGLAVVAGLLAALRPGRAWPAAAVLALAAGLTAGAVSSPAPGALRDQVLTGAGSVVSISLVIVYLSALVHVLPERIGHRAVPVAFRIVAAWTAAIAALMLALALRFAAV